MKRAWLALILALIATVGPATAKEAAESAQKSSALQPVDTARGYVDAFLAGDMQVLLDHASPELKKLMKDAASLSALRDQSVGDGAQAAGEEIAVTLTRRVKSAGGQVFAIVAQLAPDGQLVLFSIQPAGVSKTKQVAPREAEQAGDAPDGSLQKSPFAAVRWQKSQPEVRVGEEWFKLVSLDGVSASKIVAFAKRSYRDRWQMRFEEDLVELLTRMGHPPRDKVTLVVESLTSPEKRTLKDVAMTRANRDAIKAAAGAR